PIEAMNAMIKETAEIDADFVALQEVDFDSTRSYHVDERQMVFDAFKDRSGTFAINFESPYLFYPILEPHGISNSGLLTMSKFEMQSSLRRSLPIQQDLGRFIDLDRCYDVVKFNTDNGKELVLINLHLSAYTTDPTIADQQLDMLYAQITEEYSKGNYIICSGDFNKDMLGNSAEIFPCTDNKSERNWATPFKEDKLPEHFKVAKPVDLNNPVASCRDSNIPYEKGVSFLITNDAFIVSDNIEVIKADCIDLAFEWSDHNPVYMQFKLKK
ncbi:MAG: endonuclease/exonuclease/phosphatase family protein, partial [Mogibacterium sp.]|nr:endonuclease/exonuclease/phosphatase family protein [Mogibacterium sp.]